MTAANRANLWMADDATKRQLEQNVKARIKISDELVPGENLYSLGPIKLPAQFANPQGNLFATIMSIYLVNEDQVYRFDEAEVIDLISPSEIKTIKGSRRKAVPGAIVKKKSNERLLEFMRLTRNQLNLDSGKHFSGRRTRWHQNESKLVEALNLMEGVVDEFNTSYAEPSRGSISAIGIEEIVTGCYAALVEHEKQSLESARDDDWHGASWYEGVSEEKMITLKLLLEYGMQPDQFGRYQIGPKILSDLNSDSHSFYKELLPNTASTIRCSNVELALELQQAVSFLFHTFLYWEIENSYDDNLEAWDQLFD